MAGIRKLPSGKWQASVRLPDGRRLTKSDPLKGFVKDWAKDAELKLSRGEIPSPRTRRLTVVDWVDKWSAARVIQVHSRARDHAGLERIRKHWRGHLLSAPGRLEVQSWVQKMLADGVGPAAASHTYSLFAAAMKAATLENPPLIQATPCVRIQLPERVPKLPPWFREDEVVRIIAELTDPHRPMVELMVWCGLRWQEAAGLRVEDVDFLRRRIQIVGALEDRVGWKEYPKTRKSRRELPAPEHVLNDVSRYMRDARKVTDRSDERLIFLSPRTGSVLVASNWRRTWKTALEDADVAYLPPHTCRHTCASWLVQDGVPLYDVQGFMGHEDHATTQRYAHLAPDAHDRVEESWLKRMTHQRRIRPVKGEPSGL